MPKLKNVEDLSRLRGAKQQAMRLQRQTGTNIYVGMGTCGIAAGARQTMEAIRAELARLNIAAHVHITGCIGMCVKEPVVDIQQAGQPRVTYANVRADMVPRLIQEHLREGRPVKEWAVGRLSE